MPKTTHVKRAQQRYETVPVLDPETGEPIRVPLHNKDGSPKTTKTGRPVTITKVKEDRTKPLPLLDCGACGKPIEVGTPYKWIAVKRTFGGVRYNRHESCPSWQVWEYSDSNSAQVARLEHDASQALEGIADDADEDTVQSVIDEIQSEIETFRDEKQEGADALEEGFGHETYQSQELTELAENLESWVGEFEGISLPDYPEPDDQCYECEGTGKVEDPDHDDADEDGQIDCEQCEGTGTIDDQEPDPDEVTTWVEECKSLIEDAISANPC